VAVDRIEWIEVYSFVLGKWVCVLYLVDVVLVSMIDWRILTNVGGSVGGCVRGREG
jgi:hypothetical protein